MIIETGEALLNCLAYIELNPVRAGVVQRPEDYRWCSLAYHIGTRIKDDFLSTDLGMAAFTNRGYQERIALYRAYVYEKGGLTNGSVGVIPQEVLTEERKKGVSAHQKRRVQVSNTVFYRWFNYRVTELCKRDGGENKRSTGIEKGKKAAEGRPSGRALFVSMGRLIFGKP